MSEGDLKRKLEGGEESPAKIQKVEEHAGFSLNVNLALMKATEIKGFREVLDLPPSALQGIAEHSDADLKKLHINTVRELGEYKFYKLAKAVVTLAEKEETGGRPAISQMNINHGVDKEYETKSLKEIAAAPVLGLQGIGEVGAATLAGFGINTVADLAAWKFAHWAESLVALAEFENPDFSSR
eukprot:TRINITY_DN255_c0_g1_i1.p1 TRINITY_DN255_c0_g1~~TRINITY_DN255_c0_g1_i1.p1  ORF type:complete len:202 (-),score=83.20 TRINITY_DN255_c0_g1_i1:281-832(-)